jgi:fibro-slime domain-containing protein
MNSAPLKHDILSWMNKFLTAAPKRIIPVAAIFIGLFLLIQGAKVLSPRHGLQGRYYANDSWDGPPVLMTFDSSISFDKKTMSMRTGNFDRSSAIWDGYIFVPKSSTYRFSVNSDDGSWVYVDGALLIDNGGIHPAKKESKDIFLLRGSYSLRIKYFDAGDEGNVVFRWKETKTFPFLMAPLYLYPKPISFGLFVWDTVLTFTVFLFKVAFFGFGLLALSLSLRIVFPSFKGFSHYKEKVGSWLDKWLASTYRRIAVMTAVFMAIVFFILGVDGTIAADATVFKFINMHHTAFFDRLFLVITYFGNGWIMFPVFFAFLFWKIPKKRRLNIFVVAAVALSISGLSNSVIKMAVDRPRPSVYFVSPNGDAENEESLPFRIHEVGTRFSNQSFPSGHSNTAFGLATLVVLIFGIRFWPAFLVATAVAYSRVYLGAHFPLDTLAAAFIGSVLTLAVWYGASMIVPRKDWT